MIELKNDCDYRGKDIYFDGKMVGWLGFGDMRQIHTDRRPVTMFRITKGTMHHQDVDHAVQHIESVYQAYIESIT